MKIKSLQTKYRLLVLMDMSKASYNALKKTVSLAKIIGGGIDVFHVKPAIEVVKYESQLSAIRSMREEHQKQKKKLQSIINVVSEEEQISIICNYTFGNVKSEIKKHIKKTNPDVIVLGKRKKKFVKFLGDHLTLELLKNHSGGILITGDEEAFVSYNEQAMGFLNDEQVTKEPVLVQELRRHIKSL